MAHIGMQKQCEMCFISDKFNLDQWEDLLD